MHFHILRAAFKVQSVSQMSIDIPILLAHKYFMFPPEKQKNLRNLKKESSFCAYNLHVHGTV